MPRAKLISLAVLIILLLLVILQNTADTTVHLLFIRVSMPLALLLAVVLAGGVACGLITSVLISARRSGKSQRGSK